MNENCSWNAALHPLMVRMINEIRIKAVVESLVKSLDKEYLEAPNRNCQ